MHQRARRGVSYLPQERTVFRGLTSEENIAAVLEARGTPLREARGRARALLADMGLGHLALVRAVRLSGGEQRRLEVARSLAIEPRFLLFDEPFAGIDPITIETLHEVVVALRARGIGILLTDHNVRETLSLCDRAYVLDDGRVLAEGTAEELAANESVRREYLGASFRLAHPARCAG
jgi:lipopolysaccharide export system ATP-binding protein